MKYGKLFKKSKKGRPIKEQPFPVFKEHHYPMQAIRGLSVNRTDHICDSFRPEMRAKLRRILCNSVIGAFTGINQGP